MLKKIIRFLSGLEVYFEGFHLLITICIVLFCFLIRNKTLIDYQKAYR